jgi:hypothetical protein
MKSRVLAIDGKHGCASPQRSANEKTARYHQGLLVGERDIDTGLESRVNRRQARRTHDCRHHSIRRRAFDQSNRGVFPTQQLNPLRQPWPHLVGHPDIRDRHGPGRKLANLFEKSVRLASLCCQAHHSQAIGMLSHHP